MGRETGKVRRYCPQSGAGSTCPRKEVEGNRGEQEENKGGTAGSGLGTGRRGANRSSRDLPCIRAEGSRASTGASVEEGTLQGGTEGALKGPSGAGWLPPQLQGSEPRRGVEPQTDEVREAVEGASEGPQTPGTGVEEGLDPTTTPSKPGDRSGEVASQEHRSAGESAKGLTKVVAPSSGPILGQERSGGALERPGTSGSTPQSSEPERPAKRSPAEKAPGQSSEGISRSPAPSKEVSRTTTCSSVKRKATHQEDLHPESGIVPKTPGGGKRQKELIDKDTPRRTLARKTADKLKRATEENDHLPLARGTKDVPLQDIAPRRKGWRLEVPTAP